MAYKADELSELIEENYVNPHNYEWPVWEQLYSNEEVEVKNMADIEWVDSGGAEGDGAEMWVVFKIGKQLFRKTGYYSSWGESSWDGDLEEVEAIEVQRTEYEAI